MTSPTVAAATSGGSTTPLWSPTAWWQAIRLRQAQNQLATPALVAALIFYVLALFAARRALISLAPLVLLAAALLNHRRAAHWRAYWRNPAALVPAALYGILLLSGFITDDVAEWRHQLFRQLLLLAVPLAIALAPPLGSRHLGRLVGWWLGAGAAVAAATLAYFYRHRAVLEESISRSKNLDAITGVGHIYFSVMLALAVLYGAELALTARLPSRTRQLAAVAALICGLTLHVLAYRTGLVALYGALGVSVLRLLIVQRRIVLGLAMLLAVAGAPLAAYSLLPSVQRRVWQTNDDLNRFLNGQDINEYSLSQRLAAWATAGALVREHWGVGVGQADVRRAMDAQYTTHSFGLRPENRILPHNQYLQYLLGGGIGTLALLLTLLVLPVVAGPTRGDPFVRHFVVASGCALFFDSMLEVQYGLNPFILNYAVLAVGPWQARMLAVGESGRPAPPARPYFPPLAAARQPTDNLNDPTAV